MPDYDPYSIQLVDEPTALEMAKARAAALRGQNYAGLVGSLAHDPYAARSGAALMHEAQQGLQDLGQAPGERMRQALQGQQLQKAKADQSAMTGGPGTLFARALGKKIAPDLGAQIDQAPEQVLQQFMPGLENYASRQEMAKARAAAAGGGAAGGDAAAIAKEIIEGRQPPELKGMYKQGPAIRAQLAKAGFNLSDAQTEWSATQKHLSTLNSQQQERLRQAVDFTSHSLETIEGLYDDWKAVGAQTGIKAFNKMTLAAAKQLPGDAGAAATALEAQINDLTAELANVYMGGNSPTDSALKLAQHNLQADWNEQTFKKAIGLARTNLQLRKNAMMGGGSAGVGAGGSRYDRPTTTAAPAPAAAPAASQEDTEALAWAKANPNDPRAQKILGLHGAAK